MSRSEQVDATQHRTPQPLLWRTLGVAQCVAGVDDRYRGTRRTERRRQDNAHADRCDAVATGEGSVLWDGRDTRQDPGGLRAVLGYLPQDFGLPPEFTPRQFLGYMAAMKGLAPQVGSRRADELLDIVGLLEEGDRRLAALSSGMKQRVGIAQALLNDPRVLVVDEPTAGLDPDERVRYRTLLCGLAADRLVILSTHIIGDVETIATQLILLKHGRVVEDTTPAALLEQVDGRVWSVTTDPATARDLQRSHRASHIGHTRNGIALRLLSSTRPADAAVRVEATLEEAYLLRMSE